MTSIRLRAVGAMCPPSCASGCPPAPRPSPTRRSAPTRRPATQAALHAWSPTPRAPRRRPRRPPATGRATSARPTPSAPATPRGRSRSSTPTTTRTRRPTSRPTAASSVCRRARLTTAASRRSTRTAATRSPARHRLGTGDLARHRHGPAICPDCSILLVEAQLDQLANLGNGGQPRRRHGRSAICELLRRRRVLVETARTRHLQPPGDRDHRVSSGDSGYGVEFPAASSYVTAVGGTSAAGDDGSARGFTETAWSGRGSGCSAYVAKPRGRTTRARHGARSTTSAVADPNTGVAVYDTLPRRRLARVRRHLGVAPIVGSVYAHGQRRPAAPASPTRRPPGCST